jgi:nicotinate-nucleotide adenylyltransferase
VTSVTGRSGRRVGILGGTFDPPHIGHLRAAVNVSVALALDAVWVVPNGEPWQKAGPRPLTPAPIRLELARAQFGRFPGFEVLDVEVRRPGPSYTVDTVHELRAAEPDLDLTVILGSDALALVPTWERADELLGLVRLAAVVRPGGPAPFDVPGADVVWVPAEAHDTSSSGLRAAVAAGTPLHGLVEQGVVEVIEAHRLYRDGGRPLSWAR